MGETKFTPGPWEWVGDTLEVVDEPWSTVLEVEDLPRHTYSELQTGELVIQNENDRPLIATAPDLYAALEDLAGLARAAMLDANRGGCEYEVDGELADARAALAKARGETP